MELPVGISNLIRHTRELRSVPGETAPIDQGARLKILKVIHGYPMRYNAGSEVYSQTLCRALAERHEVHVFTRQENVFAPDYALTQEPDSDDSRITLHLVNNPNLKDRYKAAGVDRRFQEVLYKVAPDIVHVGHLNHLSTSLIALAGRQRIPVIFTLHDYWLMCPRGQFVQQFPENPLQLWNACYGQEDKKCAERCYARYFSGDESEQGVDSRYWTDWVSRRMRSTREIVRYVDTFIAPSQYLMHRYEAEFAVPSSKLEYLDYGFDRSRLASRGRHPESAFVFGYIGTHIPAKGIHHLIDAFANVEGDCRLRIWGRPRGQDTEALKTIASSLPKERARRIEWLPEYDNSHIVRDVFNHCDAIVVPSIWVENSPLVIHEAQQCRVPVITARAGGMSEYVAHESNGLLFEHRSPEALSVQMQRLVDSPELARELGARGYLHNDSGDIPDIADHAQKIEKIYGRALDRRDSAELVKRPAPWRITFDTNPDTCNLRCIMCEEFSPHSELQKLRRLERRPKRIMPIETIERVVADAAERGLQEIIPSTMGEPLLYKEFDRILRLCERYGVKLNLTTNGTFPRLGAEKWAELLVPLASDIKISWNGATPETQQAIMLNSRWDQMLANVNTLVCVRNRIAEAGGNRCRLTFQLTFLEQNVAELSDIVRLAIDLGFDRVKGHHLWAHFEAIEENSMRRNPEAISRWNAAVLKARAVAKRNLLANGKEILLENFHLLEDAAVEDIAPGGPCPFLGQEAWINTEGRFDPCCAPDAQRRTLGDLGNVNDQSITELWNSQAYDDLLATYPTHALCRSCNMRSPDSSIGNLA